MVDRFSKNFCCTLDKHLCHFTCMSTSSQPTISPRKAFWKCGACSHAMFHLVNQAFENNDPELEKAADPLAGGIAQKGQQCGMLWGGALALGTEAQKRFEKKEEAIGASILASKALVESFEDRAHTSNCREITGIDWENKFQSTLYMLKTMAQGIVFSKCFNLMNAWTPEAINTAKTSLDSVQDTPNARSCATDMLQMMGASEKESIMVSGMAGGIGLSGNACGALGAAIWYRTLEWGRNHPNDKTSLFKNPTIQRVLDAFNQETQEKMSCSEICGRTFKTIQAHSDFLEEGGCKKLVERLANA
jgi:C_GCAxxG_C_C family probable redox protein